MEQLKTLFSEVLSDGLIDMVISAPKGSNEILKIKVRPVLIRDTLLFQVAKYTEKQVFHENLTAEDAADSLSLLLFDNYKQAQIRMKDRNVSVLISKKGKVTVKTKNAVNQSKAGLSHNREKKYILEEGRPVPFMIDLGVMTQDGKIVRTKYDKYRQINRFLEFIEDILPELPKDRTVNIIDFGCGKSYLTFAMYYYLKELKNYDIRIIGLDLKETVIKNCQKLAEDYGYEGLEFICGDIKDFEGMAAVDMVVTLHACDTATDYALFKAVNWNASVVLSVPCCQHELNQKLQCESLSGALQYGLIKERTAALMTDAMRAQLMELEGYKVQILEFIDMEHTPKNILIRAVKHQKMVPLAVKKQKQQAFEACRDMFGVKLTLERLFEAKKEEADRDQA